MVIPSVRRYVCISEEERGLIELFDEHQKIVDYLVIAGESSASNLLAGETCNARRLTESVERVKKDSRAIRIGFPSILEGIGERAIQTTYHFNDLTFGTLAVYEKMKETERVGVGIEILGLNTNVIASILRAYSLPFPANFKTIRQ